MRCWASWQKLSPRASDSAANNDSLRGVSNVGKLALRWNRGVPIGISGRVWLLLQSYGYQHRTRRKQKSKSRKANCCFHFNPPRFSLLSWQLSVVLARLGRTTRCPLRALYDGEAIERELHKPTTRAAQKKVACRRKSAARFYFFGAVSAGKMFSIPLPVPVAFVGFLTLTSRPPGRAMASTSMV